MKAFITRAFPIPRSLVSPQVAVNISDGCLRFFEFSYTHGKLYPKKFGTMPFPRVRMNALTEKTKAEVLAALKIFVKQYGYESARFLIHEGEAYVFRTTVPTVDAGEIRQVIESKLEENVPIPPSEAVFEYTTVALDHEKGEARVSVSVVSQKTLDAYIELCMTAGIMPVSFETEARALARALFVSGDHGVHAVLSVQERHSVVFIVQDGAVAFSSSIEVGSSDFESAVAKTLGISIEDAVAMKNDKAFSQNAEAVKLFNTMIPAFSTIRDELTKVLSYWKSQEKKERKFQDVSDIVLVGGDSCVSGFAEYVAITTKLPVKMGSVWTRAFSPDEVIPDLSLKDSLDYGSVIGTLL